jgi:predicted nucleic acid-binding protein
MPVRTLDALHLASAEYVRINRVAVQLATYDARMSEAARRLGISLVNL